MKRWSIGAALGVLGISALIWAVLAGICLLAGSQGRLTWNNVHLRLEFVLVASLVGAALGGAGVAYQAILRNPLADPYLLGISSGASLFAYLWSLPAVAVGMAKVGIAGGFSQQGFAFVGAMLAVAVVFFLAGGRGRLEPVTLLLVGVIVNAVNASVWMLLNALNKDLPGGGGPYAFLVGAIHTEMLTRGQEWIALAVIGIGWIVLWWLSGQLNVAALGEAEAMALGVRVQRLRWVALIVASLVTASAVAISGPIGFVGLVCPHLGRLMVGSDTRKLLPVATGVGAGVLAVADAASRWLSSEHHTGTLLPVGVLTGLMGGPFFLYLLWRARRGYAAA